MAKHVQVAIIGSGPSGYTAAIYTGRAQLAPHLFAGYESGGQLMFTIEVENYPGFSSGIMGPKLMMEFRAQAEHFGTTIEDVRVTAVDFSARPFKLWTSFPEGTDVTTLSSYTPEQQQAMAKEIQKNKPDLLADAVIITTGASSIKLGAPGEEEFSARGVSYCAVCDAAFFREKATFVVGGGDSAMEDAMALAKFASSVTIVHRRDSFKASKIMQDRVLNHPKIKVLWNSTLDLIEGADAVESVSVTTNGKTKKIPAQGVFIAIGHTPQTQLFGTQLQLDSHGYIVTRQSATELGVAMAQKALEEGKVAYPTMTSVEGVFAGGDNVDVRYKQAITASGQGCAAALDAERWLERQN